MTSEYKKLHWTTKTFVFVLSIFSLSSFFAGWRQIHEANTLANWAVLVGGTLATLFFLGVQGYWIYFEEKAKGTLTKRVQLFEMVHEKLGSKLGKDMAQ